MTPNDVFALSAVALSKMLGAKEISSEEVVRALLGRIGAVDERIRAFTTVFRSEALANARRADEERRRGNIKGSLHGLPVSIKESLDMAGLAATLGARSRETLRADDDAVIPRMLRDAGAIILGRTNVSQLLMYHESRNPLFGQTANPWSLAHTPGGSSGGEGAAIAAGMSPLGIGTDIGGSIRVPAHFSGIAGFKPTLDRWSNAGSNSALRGQESVRSQLGPMARTTADLTLVLRALDPSRMSTLDPRVPPLPFGDPTRVDTTKLRIGTYVDDGLIAPSRAVARAVERAGAALRASGAEVTPFTPPGIPEAIHAYFGALSSDGGKTALAWLEGDNIDVSLKSLATLAKIPSLVRRATAHVLKLSGEPRLGRFLESMGEKSVAEFWKLTQEMREVRRRLLAAMDAKGLDALICPAHATPALPHTLSKDFVLAGSASMLYNLVQFPAGVVPVTRVRQGETLRVSAKTDRLEKCAAEVDRQSAGLPVGVQVVARPWADETVLAIMTAIEAQIETDPDRPSTPVAAIG